MDSGKYSRTQSANGHVPYAETSLMRTLFLVPGVAAYGRFDYTKIPPRAERTRTCSIRDLRFDFGWFDGFETLHDQPRDLNLKKDRGFFKECRGHFA